MTDKEIKFEIAKLTIQTGNSVEVARTFYEWVVEAPEKKDADEKTLMKLDDIPIETFASKTRIKGTITKRCLANDIYTVGDLIRCGGMKYRTFKKVGKGTINKIDDALERLYGIKDWYML